MGQQWKQIAQRANTPQSWLATTTKTTTTTKTQNSFKTKKQLVDHLYEKQLEYHEFVQTVRNIPYNEYLTKGKETIENGGSRIHRIKRTTRSGREYQKGKRDHDGKEKNKNKDDNITVAALSKKACFEKGVEIAMNAAVHIIPSGSGAHLGNGIILTCAHCVAHDDDIDNDHDNNETNAKQNDEKKLDKLLELINAKGETFAS